MHDASGERARRNAWRAGLLVLVVLVACFGLWHWRGTLSERLIPDPRLNQQIEQAEAALQRGELSRADGRGAKELFEAALAVDPDRAIARDGLVRVREAALARAARALRERHAAAAETSLALAQSLSAPKVQMQPLQAQLADLRAAGSDIPAWLEQAGRPGTSDAVALALYERSLEIDPDNAIALEGRRIVLGHRLAQATSALARGATAEAERLVADVIAHDPAHLDLPDVQAALGEQLAQVQRAREQQLAAAADLEKRGATERAATIYQQLLKADPELAEASVGLSRCARALALRAQAYAADADFRAAAEALGQARRWSPRLPEIAAAEHAITQARLRQAEAGTRGVDQKRLPSLLAEGQAALEREDFVSPPGSSAWDKLRVASAIAPHSAGVLKLRAAFDQRSRHCVTQAMAEGRIVRAQSCLEARILVDPTARDLPQARADLAERWLARAQERIAASDYPAAHQAINNLVWLQPAHPALPALQRRLRQAEGQAR